jgi:hypothetical protein
MALASAPEEGSKLGSSPQITTRDRKLREWELSPRKDESDLLLEAPLFLVLQLLGPSFACMLFVVNSVEYAWFDGGELYKYKTQ